MKELLSTYETLKSEITNENDRFHAQTNVLQDKYHAIQNHTEIIYEHQMMEMVGDCESVFLFSELLIIYFSAFAYTKYTE